MTFDITFKRYNWFAAQTEGSTGWVGSLNEDEAGGYALNALGQHYNTYTWDGCPVQNPQWGYGADCSWTTTTTTTTTTVDPNRTPAFEIVWTGRKNKANAKQYCEDLGMELPKPMCIQENNEIWESNVEEYNDPSQDTWLGYEKDEDNNWILTSNDYSNWDDAGTWEDSAVLQASDGTWKGVWASQWARVGCVRRIRATECDCPAGYSTNEAKGYGCYQNEPGIMLLVVFIFILPYMIRI